MSTEVTPKDRTAKPPVDLVGAGVDGPSVEVTGLPPPSAVVRFLVPTVLVGTFIGLGWTAEQFREALASITPHLTTVLWAAVVALLAVSFIRRGASQGRVGGRRLFAYMLAPCALAGSVIAYLAQLFTSWHDGGSSFVTVGGLVPWSDPNGFVGGAQRLLFTGHIDAFNARRPLHAALLAVELAVTDLDLRKVLAIQAVLLGVASYLAARAVARDLGPVAGLALFAGIFGFARVGVHTAMTETLGVAIGALAFAALWNAIRGRNVWLVAAGMFLLTLALDFRSGPMLLLLTLPLFFAWVMRGSRRINWRVLGASLASIIVAYSANYVSIITFQGDSGNLNANASYWVYGMARGFPGWSSNPVSTYQIYLDHPEIVGMSESERSRFVNARAREELTAHPGTFARSYVEGARNYVTATGDYITAPVSSYRTLVYAIALLLAAVALIARWRTSSRRVLVDTALFGGVVLAVPAVVGAWPYDDHAPWGWDVVGAGSYLPWWFGAAVGTFAFVAFILVGTERLRLDRHLLLAVVALASIAIMMPVLGDYTVRVFAAAVPFLAVAIALVVAVIERIPIPTTDATVRAPEQRRDTRASRWAPFVVGAAVAAVAVIGAPIAAVAIDKPSTPPRTCSDGRPAEPLIAASTVRLVGNASKQVQLDELQAARVRAAPPIRMLRDRGVFGPIHAGTTIVGGVTEQGHDRVAFVDGSVGVPRNAVLYLCGAPISAPDSNPVLREWFLPLDVFAGHRIGSGHAASAR